MTLTPFLSRLPASEILTRQIVAYKHAAEWRVTCVKPLDGRGDGYFTPDSRLLRRYMSRSALLTPPNGIGFAGPDVLIAAGSAGFFAW
jgi:hypothetical protein